MERTLVLLKPDALQRGLTGEVTRRLEAKGLKLIGTKMIRLSEAVLNEHYAHLVEKPFFPGVKAFMMSLPVIVQCWEGVEVVDAVRILVGITKARAADAGSIRGDLAMSFQCNIVHASDSVDSAKKEIERFFKPDELYTYDKTEYMHVYSQDEK